MTADDLGPLQRAHDLFGGAAPVAQVSPSPDDRPVYPPAGQFGAAYRDAGEKARAEHSAARRIDAGILRIIEASVRDHERARLDTAAVLAAARADRRVPDSPIAARELLRRRLHRLHTQRGHLLAAHRRARRHRAAIAALRYRQAQLRRSAGGVRAERAVQAALSRLGRPYVWGATGPDRFDCSGLVKWSYAQAGMPLPRTTYDQINAGVPVARADIRPGDLVFPHTGHVQMAIGDNLVVEAPHAGAPVRISPLGGAIAIRRPG